MPAKPANQQAQLDAWRDQGADRMDPLRFGLIAAMARRAENHEGQVRERLDARLAELVDAYADCVAATAQATTASCASTPLPGPLRDLLDHIGGGARTSVPTLDPDTPIASVATAKHVATPDLEPLAALDEFQQLWSRIRIDSLLRQSLESISEDAGPMHSSVLLHRAMNLMRDVSPEYLQHFLAYADVLTWMEQLGGGSAATEGDAGRAVSGRKTARPGGVRRKK